MAQNVAGVQRNKKKVISIESRKIIEKFLAEDHDGSWLNLVT